MNRYRIILTDHAGLGRSRDITFPTLDAATDFVNGQLMEASTCVFQVLPETGSVALETYVVWNNIPAQVSAINTIQSGRFSIARTIPPQV